MQYSVYDPLYKRYFVQGSHYPPDIHVPPSYGERPFVNWTEIYVNLPNDVYPLGVSDIAQGIVAHPDELHQAACSPGKDILVSILLFLGVWGAKKAFVGAKNWADKRRTPNGSGYYRDRRKRRRRIIER